MLIFFQFGEQNIFTWLPKYTNICCWWCINLRNFLISIYLQVMLSIYDLHLFAVLSSTVSYDGLNIGLLFCLCVKKVNLAYIIVHSKA